MRGARAPQRFSGTPADITRPAPTPGQHTEEVLAAAGYDAERLAALRAEGVIVGGEHG